MVLNQVKTDIDVLADVAEQVQNAEPDQIRAYFEGLMPKFLDFGVKVLLALVIWFVGTKIIKLLRRILRRFLERSHVDVGVKQFLDSFAKAAMYFCLFMMLLGWLGISTASVVAVLGSAGLAIGMALQGSLGNFAGGVLILLLRPFKVGDYIIEDGNKNEGTVTEIQLFYTKLQTPDNRVIVIPNGSLANSSLTNVTQQDKRRLDLYVGIAYEADLKEAKRVLAALIDKEERRLAQEEHIVFVDSLEDSCVRLGCRLWVATGDYWQVKWDLTEQMKLALDEAGISIPFNQLEVTLKEHDTQGKM